MNSPKLIKGKHVKTPSGFFAEILHGHDLFKPKFGQVSLTSFSSNTEIGNHYHKKLYEYFTVVKGSVEFNLEDIKSGKKIKYLLSEKDFNTLFIPPFWNHILRCTNKGEAVLLLYATREFNENKPDVYQLPK